MEFDNSVNTFSVKCRFKELFFDAFAELQMQITYIPRREH